MNIIGEVGGRNVLLLDDMIDTAGTLAQGAIALREKGARTILAGCTHPVLSGPALDRINQSPLDTLVVTNTLPLNGKEEKCRKLVSLTVAPLLGEAIKRIHEEESVSSLFV
jgi:ribose-phosphate pyrophosphokinase